MNAFFTSSIPTGKGRHCYSPGGPSSYPASFFPSLYSANFLLTEPPSPRPRAKYKPPKTDEEQAVNLVWDTVIDNEVYGRGKYNPSNRKYMPVFANKRDIAPQRYDRATKRYEYNCIGEKNFVEHVNGIRPYFMCNVAEERREVWDENGLRRLLFEMYQHSETPYNADKEDAFVVVMTSARPPLSPVKARNLIKGKSGKDAMVGDDLLTRFKKFLLKQRNTKLVYRLLSRAIKTEYIPVWEFEFTVDIDGDDGYEKSLTAAHAKMLARRCVDEVFTPAGISTCIEPSRNRGGAYIHFRFRRESCDPAAVNDMLAVLLSRLKQIRHDDLAAHVCKIGGRLATWVENPEYDVEAAAAWQYGDEAMMTAGESYIWRKHHAGMKNADGTIVPWEYDSTLEPRILTGIDLVTYALHDLPADADGRKERLAKYREYAAKPAASESALRKFLGMDEPNAGAAPAVKEIKTAKKTKKGKAARGRANTINIPTGDYFTGLVATYGMGSIRDISILLDTSATEHGRFGAAARLAMRRNKGNIDTAIPEALMLVELGDMNGEIGPATGPRTVEREDHIRRCCEHWEEIYDESLSGSGGGKASEPTPWLFGTNKNTWAYVIGWAVRHIMTPLHVSDELVSQVQVRHPNAARLTQHLIAVAYIVILHAIHTLKLREVPRNFLIGGMAELGYWISKDTAAALFELLTDERANLLKQELRSDMNSIDEDGCITREYSHGPGECRMFALRRGAVIPPWLRNANVEIQYTDTDVTKNRYPNTDIIKTIHHDINKGKGPSGNKQQTPIIHDNYRSCFIQTPIYESYSFPQSWLNEDEKYLNNAKRRIN